MRSSPRAPKKSRKPLHGSSGYQTCGATHGCGGNAQPQTLMHCYRPPYLYTISSLCVPVLFSDSCMGSEEHEDVPARSGVFPQSGGGMWGPEGGVCCDQEHEKEPQLPQLGPFHQSGNDVTR